MPLSPLVGRRAELTALLSACGSGGVTLVTGEAGIGKTRILDEVAERVGGGAEVLRGHAVPGGGPFRPLVEALVRASPPRLATDPALVPFRAVLARLLPGWPVPPAAGAHVVDPVVVLGEAVTALLGVLAGTGPRVVLLDDLHWSDADTLAVLEYLAGTRPPVRLIGAARVDAPADGLAALRRHPAVTEVPLAPLTADEVAALAGQVGGGVPDPDAAALLTATADGLPLLVEELTTGLVRSGGLRREAGRLGVAGTPAPRVPDPFARLVEARLTALAPAHRDLVVAAAVLGPELDWALLVPATGAPERDVAAALRAAHGAGLLVDGPRWRHALTRDAVLATLSGPERAVHAAALATALDAAGADATRPGLVADLHARGGRPGRAARLLVDQAARSTAAGALAAASAVLDRAVVLAAGDPAQRAAVATERVRVLALRGRADEAVAAADAALPGAVGATRTALALAAARACVAAERFAEADRYLDQAGDGPAVAALRAHAALGLGDPATAQAAARRASDADDPAVACEALEALGRVLRRPDPAGSRAALTRAVEIAARHGLAPWRIRALAELGAGTMIELGGTAELERAAELAVESGMLGTAVALELQITVGTVAIEGYVAASRRARRCAERAGRLGMASARSFALLFAARGQVFAGSLAEAEALLDEAQTGSAEPHLRLARSGLRARDAWLSGDDARAVEGMAAGVAALRTAPGSNPAPLWGEWALLRTVLDPSDAGPRGELRASDVMVNLLNRAALHYADAVAASAAGDAAAAAVAFARAETVAADQPYYRHLFRAQLLPRAGSPGLPDPAGLLREQLAFLAGRGEDRLTELARRRLRALGLPVPRPARDVEPVPAPLRARGVTGRELQVLRLVGAGLSNPEIAARLHLSPRTVETHVGRLLAKTGAARRAELARHLPT
ncbi:hypothetical protein PHY01_01610 [Pseudonocardia hydrocarbonoxydans]|uniref:HTH luxR-type domain-containing protein n=1 Tax=Pseudonocardia hydrocarbonoxydans TaxID=76726 RepID=A0A4Y3WHA5_9PSEU|nr:LuxR family transcriptional regulator [Pseudonocardia hydrocarbonoxydans]GEC17878.1 hypothetical protein PHY01_01610 [Pseudonocardia hydrocarbonoxydans]